MLTPKELSEQVGMPIEAAERALAGAKMMATPFAGEIRSLVQAHYHRWLGEAADGRVEIYANYPHADNIVNTLKEHGYSIGASLWGDSGLCIYVFKKNGG